MSLRELEDYSPKLRHWHTFETYDDDDDVKCSNGKNVRTLWQWKPVSNILIFNLSSNFSKILAWED